MVYLEAGFKKPGPGELKWVRAKAEKYKDAVALLRSAESVKGLNLYAGPLEITEKQYNSSFFRIIKNRR